MIIVGIVRDRHVPIPGSGLQLTNIAHVRDLSSMLTLAVENPDAASHCIFNCVGDRAVTLDGFAKLCAQAAGRPVNIVHYDPKVVGVDAKKAFPFRNTVITTHSVSYYKTHFQTIWDNFHVSIVPSPFVAQKFIYINNVSLCSTFMLNQERPKLNWDGVPPQTSLKT